MTLASPRLSALVGEASARATAAVTQRCELCGAAIGTEHRHVLDIGARQPLCACRACAVLFDRDAAGGDHFRLIPERRHRVEGLPLDDAAWQELGVPVGLAFFYRTTDGETAVVYPGPLGPTDAVVDRSVWVKVEQRDPLIAGMQPEVEGLLVHRLRGARHHWLVPIDDCYRLVALFRTKWQGLSGGDEVWTELERFFAELAIREEAG